MLILGFERTARVDLLLLCIFIREYCAVCAVASYLGADNVRYVTKCGYKVPQKKGFFFLSIFMSDDVNVQSIISSQLQFAVILNVGRSSTGGLSSDVEVPILVN